MSDQSSTPTAAVGPTGDLDAALAALLNNPSGGVANPFDVYTHTLADPTAQVFTGRPFQPGVRPVDTVQRSPYGPAGPVGPDQRNRLFQLDLPTFQQTDTFRSVGDLLQDFYKMDVDKLTDIQRLLYAGGWYGNVDILDVAWGQHDEATFSAWAQVITRAARFNQAGVKKTPMEVLEEAAGTGGGLGGNGSGGSKPVVSLSDPAELRQSLDAVAVNVLGRKATAEEQRMFIGAIHSMQQGSQLAAQQAQGGRKPVDYDANHDGRLTAEEIDQARQAAQAEAEGGGVAVIQPSPQAQAEEQLRAANPVEAGAHDISNQFGQFLQLLRGVV